MLIDDYVAGLHRALDGPSGAKRDLVVEARDSLADTAEAYEEGGLARAEAERLAVAEFGEVAEIAPGYQRELTATAGRRLAALLFVSVPLTTLLWSLVWAFFPVNAADWAQRPDWFLLVARLLDLFQLATGVLGGLTLLALTWGARWVRRPERLTRVLALWVWAMLPVTLLFSLALQYGSHGPTGFSGYLPGVLLSLTTPLLNGLQLYGAARCLRISRRPLPA
ncbi:permease prefix domain 1-containing protein [Nonomuraea sp. NPDC059194]|uniref:permease prefix domain 1-containing protein n=1 Tax=Nonomuraea sp. NPDC059194 TaxID=3346764 RepID=UPI0036BC3E93